MKRINKKFLINDTLTSVVIIIDYIDSSIVEVIRLIDKKIQEKSSLYEIVCIDNTGIVEENKIYKKIQKSIPKSRFIYLSKKYSHDIALTVGVDSCIGDYVIFYDLSTDYPDLVETFLNQLIRGYDMVIGYPFTQKQTLSWFSRMFIWFISNLSQHGYFYRTNYTVGLNRRAVLAITRTRRKNRNLAYLNSLIGLKKALIEYKSTSNKLNFNPRQSFWYILVKILNDIISNSFKPIRMISFLGMFGSTLFLLYIIVVVFLVVFLNMTWIAPQGWISLATIIGCMFFLLFSCLTIMSEYLIRIMDETRDEPLYFISQEFDSSHFMGKVSHKRSSRLNIVKV